MFDPSMETIQTAQLSLTTVQDQSNRFHSPPHPPKPPHHCSFYRLFTSKIRNYSSSIKPQLPFLSHSSPFPLPSPHFRRKYVSAAHYRHSDFFFLSRIKEEILVFKKEGEKGMKISINSRSHCGRCLRMIGWNILELLSPFPTIFSQ